MLEFVYECLEQDHNICQIDVFKDVGYRCFGGRRMQEPGALRDLPRNREQGSFVPHGVIGQGSETPTVDRHLTQTFKTSIDPHITQHNE